MFCSSVNCHKPYINLFLFKEAAKILSRLCEEFQVSPELEGEMQSLLETLRDERLPSHFAIGIFVLKCHLKLKKEISAVQVASFLKRIKFRDQAMTYTEVLQAIQKTKAKLSWEEIENLDLAGTYLNLNGEPADEAKVLDPYLFDKAQLDKESNPPKG